VKLQEDIVDSILKLFKERDLSIITELMINGEGKIFFTIGCPKGRFPLF
jgi:hypothetical protein